MYTNITNLETFDDSVLLNDNWEKNLKIELNDWTLINAIDYYPPELLWFRWDDVKNYSHNAIRLPSWNYVIYYKPLWELISKETIEDILNLLKSINTDMIFDEFGNKADIKDVNLLLSDNVEWEWFKITFFISKYKEYGFSNYDDYMIDKFAD